MRRAKDLKAYGTFTAIVLAKKAQSKILAIRLTIRDLHIEDLNYLTYVRMKTTRPSTLTPSTRDYGSV